MINEEKTIKILKLYNKYVYEILNLKEIKRYASKRTITDKVLNPKRANEQKLLDAIKGLNLALGDKVYVYYDLNDNLQEISKWNNDHNIPKLLERLYKTMVIFENVIDLSQFKNYKLKKNQKELGI